MKSFSRTALLIAVVAVIGAGCGSGKSSPTRSASRPAPATTAASPRAGAATATSPSITTGPVRATLHGENHTPAATKRWTYTLRVTDSAGKPLDGTVKTEFVFSGVVVGTETPAMHRLKHGALKDTIEFPRASVGHPVMMVTVVRTSAGSVALGWAVTAR